MSILRIRGGRIIDPSQKIDRVDDLWIENGIVRAIGTGSSLESDETIEATGHLVVPGLVDMHVHLREPGGASSETIESGSQAALEGGITSVVCMADTEPVIDNQSAAEFVTLQATRAGKVNVWPVGSISKHRDGQELAEMAGLILGGAVAFGEGDKAVANPELMRRALEYSQMFGRPVFCYPEAGELTKGGLINEGSISVRLGMPGIPWVAEQMMVDRDLQLARYTSGTVHVQSLSCSGSVQSVRRAKSEGVKVTSEVAIHHLCLTEERVADFDSVYKVNPPLRTAADVESLLAGLADGTIDAIVSDHTPCASEQKLREFDEAPFGMIGMETLLSVAAKTLIDTGRLTWSQLIEKLSFQPARILGLKRGTLAVGAIADVTIIDPNAAGEISTESLRSRSRNCPYHGWKIGAVASTVIVGGEIRFRRATASEELGA